MTYTHVAVFIHWVTALLIIGLLAIGKFMTGLDEADTLRFTLTQWHKTFGILVLLLSCLRILWRLTHRAPAHPVHAPVWEKFCASISHFAFYVLILFLPLSGWAMASVSTLDIDTLLFNRILWPHLPLIEWLSLNDTAARELWEHRFHHAHHVAGSVLIVLLLVHIAAALKHQFIDKDDVLRRMKPRVLELGFLGLLAFVAIAIGAAYFALTQIGAGANAGKNAMVAGSSSVTLVADVTGSETLFEFSGSTVEANINLDNPSSSSLKVTVLTENVTGRNYQAVGSLPNPDWFDVANFPEATFQSTDFESGQNQTTLRVTGDLNIKGTTQAVEFLLSVATDENTGESIAAVDLPIDRFDYSIGLKSQPNEDSVGAIVTIQVRFQLGIEN